MDTNYNDEILRVDAVVASLRAVDATAQGQEMLSAALAGLTHPDHGGF